MTLIRCRDCLASEVESQPIINGSFIICRDTGDAYCDTVGGDRVTLGRFVHSIEGTCKDYLYPEDGHMYYSTTDKNICFYKDSTMWPIDISVFAEVVHDVFVGASASTDITDNVALPTGYAGTVIAVIPVKSIPNLAVNDLVDTSKMTFGTPTIDTTEKKFSCTVSNANTSNFIGSFEFLTVVTNRIAN